MTIALLVLLVGCVLIVVAVLAVRAGSVRFARLNSWPRVTTAATGALCLSAGSILLLSHEPSTATGPVSETIVDEISAGEVSESVKVFIDGRYVGALHITKRSPVAKMTVTVAKPGRHEYRTEARITLTGEQPKRTSYTSEVFIDGEGTLEVLVDPTTLRAFVQPAK